MPNELPKQLPAEGFVRLAQIIGPGGPIPVSKTTWWRGVKDGTYPRPVKLSANITAWKVCDIRRLLSVGEAA
jgi:prophage regulatory protein